MNLIDRYILKKFVFTLVFSLVALIIIFLVVNIFEQLDEFLDKDASFLVIIDYYASYLPEIIKLLVPIAMLLATLFTFGKLSTSNEITAIKTGGMSLYRMMLPIMLFAFMIGAGHLYFVGWTVPKATEHKLEIEYEYLHKGNKSGPIYNLYFRDTPLKHVIMRYYNSNTKIGNQVAIEEYSSEMSPRLISRVEAEKIIWDSVNSSWKLLSGIKREFEQYSLATEIFDSTEVDLQITHDELIKLKTDPTEMSLDERRNHLSVLKKGGKDIRKQLINYHAEIAFPFANIIVVLFGIPFASVRKKGGIAVQIGAAMVIAFMYMIFTEVSKGVGYASNINPILSAWLANIIFAVAGIIVLIKSRT